jgi:adenylylsulfate kinase-like enzyme
MIYNFIGQPHSGKTTLSKHLYSALKASNPDRELTILLDGDLLRKILNNTKFDEEGRSQNISAGLCYCDSIC